MSSPRHVFLDPDGAAADWLYVVVTAPTGVVYQQQYGGTACRQGEAEGVLVPVRSPDELGALRQLFEQYFRGAGTRNRPWTPDERATLRSAAGDTLYRLCDGVDTSPTNCAGTRAGWTRRTRHGCRCSPRTGRVCCSGATRTETGDCPEDAQ
ncbi:DUF6210 family protein [Streptomyces sp. NBC_00057]